MQTTLLITALALGAPAPKEAPKSPIVGTWMVMSMTKDGKTHQLKGNRYWTFTVDGKHAVHAVDTLPRSWQKYEVNEKTRPRSLDVVHNEDVNQTELFVFEIDGDTLTVCAGAEGRPTSISAKEGSGTAIFTLKRVKAKD